MRYVELFEEPVISSWIADISYDENRRSVSMTTLAGYSYEITGVDETVYEEWLDAISKGKFWWSDIKDLYNVYRVA